tara:strand:- start:172 stop:894 length:723 start_codon:yes stop_codon:yes gene_type:complete
VGRYDTSLPSTLKTQIKNNRGRVTVDNEDGEGRLLSRTRWTPDSKKTQRKQVRFVKELPWSPDSMSEKWPDHIREFILETIEERRLEREKREASIEQDVLGVDMGKGNRAVDSDGDKYRRLKTAHAATGRLVQKARQTNRIIAIEGFLNDTEDWGWKGFTELLGRKAKRVGVRVVRAYPEYTSQKCPNCGRYDEANRRRTKFRCIWCGLEGHADVIAAINIRNNAIDDLYEEREIVSVDV